MTSPFWYASRQTIPCHDLGALTRSQVQIKTQATVLGLQLRYSAFDARPHDDWAGWAEAGMTHDLPAERVRVVYDRATGPKGMPSSLTSSGLAPVPTACALGSARLLPG